MKNFVKLSNGHVINTDYIVNIWPVTVADVLCKTTKTDWERAQAGIKKTPLLDWHRCSTHEEARDIVAEDPEHRGWSEDFVNPGYYEDSGKLGYTTNRLDGKGGFYHVDNAKSSTENPNKIAYYVVSIVNNAQECLTPVQYAALEELLEILYIG